MSRPRTRDYAEVAHVARHAMTQGQRPNAAVAAHYGISEPAAYSAIRQARKAGHHIPVAYGHTVNGRYVLFNEVSLSGKDFTPPAPLPGHVHGCADCGHQAATGWELAAHTLETHGRTLTATERTPITRNEENAA